MPRPKEDITAAGVRTRFSSTNQPANRGRKPSHLKKWIKDNNVTSDDFVLMFKNLSVKTIAELKEMVKGDNADKLPAVMANGISALLHDMKQGSMRETNSILDRIMGKPAQQVTVSDARSDIPVDVQERQELKEYLLQKLQASEARRKAQATEKTESE